MSAKKFDTNVAMSWISSDIQESQKVEVPAEEKKEPVKEAAPKEVKDESKKTVTKKEPAATKEPKKQKENQLFTIVGKELKKRQTSLLLKESTYMKLEALSKKNGISVNSCINQILEQVLD